MIKVKYFMLLILISLPVIVAINSDLIISEGKYILNWDYKNHSGDVWYDNESEYNLRHEQQLIEIKSSIDKDIQDTSGDEDLSSSELITLINELKEEIDSLKSVNDKTIECLDLSKDFTEYKICVNGI